MIARDYAGWTLDVEALAVAGLCRRMGLRVVDGAWMSVCDEQAVFHVDQFILLNTPDWKRHRVGIAYYHGIPNTGHPEFDEVFENFRRLHERLAAVQVSHREMKGVLLSAGIAESKLHVIPIGFRADWFRPPTAVERARIRRELDLPDSALVIGSFQKDGVGWGAGMDPKLIKGPDVFLAAVRRLHAEIPDVHVLLTGPARGYVRRGLEEAGIPYRHRMLRSYRETARMYHALDAYIVSSRQEGGPKAVLESMATGVPIVSTRVGQATDLIRHGENGYLVEIGDADGLAYWTVLALRDSQVRARLVRNGLRTAADNNYDAQLPLWRRFMKDLLAE
jgi:glycosyltransferase involved in cell wall biosynthesis